MYVCVCVHACVCWNVYLFALCKYGNMYALVYICMCVDVYVGVCVYLLCINVVTCMC